MDFSRENIKSMIYGSAKSEENKEDNVNIVNKSNPDSVIETYSPNITRETLSLYEYVSVITKLAKYLNTLTNLDKYVDDVEVNQIINPAELAFNLLNDNKFDAIIDRGYEKVTFSKLKIKQQWKDTISNYFKSQHDAIENEILKPLNLLDE